MRTVALRPWLSLLIAPLMCWSQSNWDNPNIKPQPFDKFVGRGPKPSTSKKTFKAPYQPFALRAQPVKSTPVEKPEATQDLPVDTDAPWYDTAADWIAKAQASLTKLTSEQKQEIRDMVATNPSGDVGNKTDPVPTPTSKSKGASSNKKPPTKKGNFTESEDGILTITVTKGIEKAAVAPSPTLDDAPVKVTSEPLRQVLREADADAAQEFDEQKKMIDLHGLRIWNDSSAMKKMGGLNYLFRGELTDPPLRNFVEMVDMTLKYPQFDIRTIDGQKKFYKGSINWPELKLCENSDNIYVTDKNQSPIHTPKKWQKAGVDKNEMRFISEAHNQLTSTEDKKLFWLAFSACTAYKESGGYWSHKGKHLHPELWKSNDPDAAEIGVFQLEPYQGRRNGIGNVKPSVQDHNDKYPSNYIPETVDAVTKALGEQSQSFNMEAGLGKIFSNFACQQTSWNLKDTGGQSCVSPFNHCYNHFGSHMWTSKGFTNCMKKFVYQGKDRKYKFDVALMKLVKASHLSYKRNPRQGFELAEGFGEKPSGASPSSHQKTIRR